MAKHALLSNVEHKGLRIITTRAAAYGDNQMFALAVPAEFRNISGCYPIVFQKRSDSGEFQPLALFGFQPGENLFLTDAGWDATYIPFSVERLPFLIGGGTPAEPGQPARPVVHIDLDSPRVSWTEGEPLFLEYGGSTPYLERVSGLLGALHAGIAATQPFVEALLSHDLLESFVLDVQLKDGSNRRLAGFHTVNEERMRKLDGAVVARLHEQGFLEAAYMVVASTVHFRDLIERSNRRV
ncbi:MAG TPA: SapC family protein [Steroidobacteraceae bacterium]|nr:SapC family protein [Steroidobacteraceae bacterium]